MHEPEKYRLELLREDDSVQDVTLLAIDVIHDLAIVRAESLGQAYLSLSKQQLSNGDRIYSMGNPHDLGMTIIEGNYNGFVQHVRHQKILFSGSLNAGMSGGPALNTDGEVIGINVSKGGEQISFLVPVNNLILLLTRTLATLVSDFSEQIRIDLLEDQKQFFMSALNKPVEREKLGDVMLPVSLADSLKCWGHTKDNERDNFKGVHQHCRSKDHIFISNDLYTGNFYYNYEWITTDTLNPFQFYTAVERRFDRRNFKNTYREDEVSNFKCHTKRVTMSDRQWKVSSCLRGYIKYKGLYDASLIMASLDENRAAAVVEVGASGIGKDTATRLFKYFMESVQWSH